MSKCTGCNGEGAHQDPTGHEFGGFECLMCKGTGVEIPYRTALLDTAARNTPPGSDYVTVDAELDRIKWRIGERYGMTRTEVMRDEHTQYVADIVEHVRAWWAKEAA